MKISDVIKLLLRAKHRNGDIAMVLYDRHGQELKGPVTYDTLLRTKGNETQELICLAEVK